MVNPLKKDLNKPSPYNGGVVLCRIALFFLSAAALAFVWRLSCELPGLKAQGAAAVTQPVSYEDLFEDKQSK